MKFAWRILTIRQVNYQQDSHLHARLAKTRANTRTKESCAAPGRQATIFKRLYLESDVIWTLMSVTACGWGKGTLKVKLWCVYVCSLLLQLCLAVQPWHESPSELVLARQRCMGIWCTVVPSDESFDDQGERTTHRGLKHTWSVSNLPLKGSRGQKSKVGEDLDVWWNWVVALASCIFAAAQSLAI